MRIYHAVSIEGARVPFPHEVPPLQAAESHRRQNPSLLVSHIYPIP